MSRCSANRTFDRPVSLVYEVQERAWTIHRLNCSPTDRSNAMQVRATGRSPCTTRFISRLDNRLHFTHDGALKNVRRILVSSLLNSILRSFLVSHHAAEPRHGGRCHSNHSSIDSFHRVEHVSLSSIDLNLSFSLKCGQSSVASVEELAASIERSQSTCKREGRTQTFLTAPCF